MRVRFGRKLKEKKRNNMAFYPAHCDNICEGCEKNHSDWCIWKDRGVSGNTVTAADGHKLETKVTEVTSSVHLNDYPKDYMRDSWYGD